MVVRSLGTSAGNKVESIAAREPQAVVVDHDLYQYNSVHSQSTIVASSGLTGQ